MTRRIATWIERARDDARSSLATRWSRYGLKGRRLVALALAGTGAATAIKANEVSGSWAIHAWHRANGPGETLWADTLRGLGWSRVSDPRLASRILRLAPPGGAQAWLGESGWILLEGQVFHSPSANPKGPTQLEPIEPGWPGFDRAIGWARGASATKAKITQRHPPRAREAWSDSREIRY